MIVEKPVDNSVENSCICEHNAKEHSPWRDIHRVIQQIFERFPPFFAEKRYKLIIFAPKLEIVDKLCY